MAGSASGSVPGQLSLTFSAGVVGSVVSLLIAWLLQRIGLFATIGCHLPVSSDEAWICSRLVWGGIFGLFFVLPVIPNSFFKRGLLLGLLPGLFELLVVLPIFQGQTVLGLNLGYTTPLVVMALSLLWGVLAASWLKMSS